MRKKIDINKLTDREKKVLYLIAQGYSYNEIASVLFFSPETIKRTIFVVIKKLLAKNKSNAVTIAYKSGILEDNLFADCVNNKL